MKSTLYLLLIPFAAFTLIALPSCNNDGPGEKMAKEVDDALDARPNEKLKDAVENAGDNIKDATN